MTNKNTRILGATNEGKLIIDPQGNASRAKGISENLIFDNSFMTDGAMKDAKYDERNTYFRESPRQELTSTYPAKYSWLLTGQAGGGRSKSVAIPAFLGKIENPLLELVKFGKRGINNDK